MQVVEQTATVLRLEADPGAGEVLVLAAVGLVLWSLWYVWRDRQRLRWKQQAARFVAIALALGSMPFSLYFGWRPVTATFDRAKGKARLVETTGLGTTVRDVELPLEGLRCEVEKVLYANQHTHAHVVLVSGQTVEELTPDAERLTKDEALAKTVNDFLQGR